jgi:hypothetical protein
MVDQMIIWAAREVYDLNSNAYNLQLLFAK